MSPRPFLIGALLAGSAGLVGFGAAGRQGDAVEYTDFGQVRTPTEPAFVAAVEPPSAAPIKEFRIPITHGTDLVGACGRDDRENPCADSMP